MNVLHVTECHTVLKKHFNVDDDDDDDDDDGDDDDDDY